MNPSEQSAVQPQALKPAPLQPAPQAGAIDAPKPSDDASAQAGAEVRKLDKPVSVRRQRKVQKQVLHTASVVEDTEVEGVESDALPSSLTLAAPYGFYEGEGDQQVLRMWQAGQTVTDPAEIALLVERGAVFTEA